MNTFANKFSVWIHPTKFFADLVVNRFILLKIIESQMFRYLVQLLVTWSLIEEGGHFDNLTSQIL